MSLGSASPGQLARSRVRRGAMLANLRGVAVAAGIGWSLAFIAVRARYRLQLYGDGAIFSYAVAIEDGLGGALAQHRGPHLRLSAHARAGASLCAADSGRRRRRHALRASVCRRAAAGACSPPSRSTAPMAGRSLSSPAPRPPACARWCSASRPRCGWRMRCSGRRSRSAITAATADGFVAVW